MKNKIAVIQFMPYFPPHKGGVETVGQEIGKFWVKKQYGEFINIVFDVGQEKNTHYEQDGYKVFLLPSFDIISNFPVPKFWKKEFWSTLKQVKRLISPHSQPLSLVGKGGRIVVMTHTRFFLSSFLGGIFAKLNGYKWLHLEHGSDYVKLSSKLVTYASIVYDHTFGRITLVLTDRVLAISEGSKKFIKKFTKREVRVFYRGIDLEKKSLNKSGERKLVFIGRLVTLKGVDILLKAFSQLDSEIHLDIIGDGAEKENLEALSLALDIKHRVSFLGFMKKQEVADYLSRNHCILVNPSYQEGMPTTVIEALFYGNIVVATDVGGTKEITQGEDLLLCEAGSVDDLINKLSQAIDHYDTLVGKSLSHMQETFDRDKNIEKLYLECKNMYE